MASMASPSNKSRARRARKDNQLRKELLKDSRSSVSSLNLLSERKNDLNVPRSSLIRSASSRGSFAQKARRGSTAPSRTVMGLRPIKAMIVQCHISVEEAARKMAGPRADAALVTLNGNVCGIITDSDVTKRVVAAGKSAGSIPVSIAMTGSPMTMKPSDPAYDALKTMVDRHFRHMPVLRSKSSVVGILDINRCIADAIKRHESKNKGLLSGLKFTLNDIVTRAKNEAPSVQQHDAVVDAAKVMSKQRKTAVLVKDSGDRVVGILTTKDVMLRVVAMRLPPQNTTVTRVMTPHPDTVPDTMTVGEALKRMRSKRYLHLPVHDHKTKEVIGLVDALELCFAVVRPAEAMGNDEEDDRGILEQLLEGGDSDRAQSDSESAGTGSIAHDNFSVPGWNRQSMADSGQSIRRAAYEKSVAVAARDSKEAKERDAKFVEQFESSLTQMGKNLKTGYTDAFSNLEDFVIDKLNKGVRNIKEALEENTAVIKSEIKKIAHSKEPMENLEIKPAGKTKVEFKEGEAILNKLGEIPEMLHREMKRIIEPVNANLSKLNQNLVQDQTLKAMMNNLVSLTKAPTTGAAAASLLDVKKIVEQMKDDVRSIDKVVRETNIKIDNYGKSPLSPKMDTKGETFSALEIVRNKLDDLGKNSFKDSVKVEQLTEKLQDYVQSIRADIGEKLDKDISVRVENELYKVAGASAICGMLLGMLAMKLFS